MSVQIASMVTKAIIAWFQRKTNRARLQNELFDRRYAMYEKIVAFLEEVVVAEGAPEIRRVEFCKDMEQGLLRVRL